MKDWNRLRNGTPPKGRRWFFLYLDAGPCKQSDHSSSRRQLASSATFHLSLLGHRNPLSCIPIFPFSDTLRGSTSLAPWPLLPPATLSTTTSSHRRRRDQTRRGSCGIPPAGDGSLTVTVGNERGKRSSPLVGEQGSRGLWLQNPPPWRIFFLNFSPRSRCPATTLRLREYTSPGACRGLCWCYLRPPPSLPLLLLPACVLREENKWHPKRLARLRIEAGTPDPALLVGWRKRVWGGGSGEGRVRNDDVWGLEEGTDEADLEGTKEREVRERKSCSVCCCSSLATDFMYSQGNFLFKNTRVCARFCVRNIADNLILLSNFFYLLTYFQRFSFVVFFLLPFCYKKCHRVHEVGN